MSVGVNVSGKAYASQNIRPESQTIYVSATRLVRTYNVGARPDADAAATSSRAARPRSVHFRPGFGCAPGKQRVDSGTPESAASSGPAHLDRQGLARGDQRR